MKKNFLRLFVPVFSGLLLCGCTASDGVSSEALSTPNEIYINAEAQTEEERIARLDLGGSVLPVLPDVTTAEDNSVLAPSLLRKGDQNPVVMQLQERLMSLGYMDNDEPTDFYGDATSVAVMHFQRQNGLTQDGICGTETWDKIFSSSAPYYKVSKGDDGDDIARIQQRLYELGYLTADSVTGYFGDTTEEAVKKLQDTNAIGVDGTQWQYGATGEVIRFDGFLRLYSESTDDETSESSEAALPKLVEGEKVTATQVTATERFTVPPARYNEASLVKKLEELGIGRPSTYAPTITTIINRGYVVKQNREEQRRGYTQLTLGAQGRITEKNLTESFGKEKNRLSPTDIGMVVNDYLESQFSQIMDYNFTANVEKEFDRIADGKITWSQMIEDFYGPFHKMVDKAIGTQNDKSAQVRILGTDPATGHTVKARIGRYGPMVEIEGAEGEKSRFASLKKGQLIASITLDEALELFALPRNLGKYEGEDLIVGIGRYGAYVRYGKSFVSLAKGDDPYTIGYDRAVELIEQHKAAAAAAAVPLKTFTEDADMLIKNGPYGAYIAYKGKNYRMPHGRKPEDMTYDECLEAVKNSKSTKGSRKK